MASNLGDTIPPRRAILLTLITLLSFALRVQRLDWQPLWWDEGYSVFFATEPLSQMISLTARDIHPPGYYAALHAWLRLISDTDPATLRLFSVGAGTLAIPLLGALCGRLANGHLLAALSAALLLALNPMHIYYSQEVRMYSLAATLAIAASLSLVEWVRAARAGRTAWLWLCAFLALAWILVHTLYYAGVVVAVNVAWAAWTLRGRRRSIWALVVGSVAVIALSLPWMAYASPRLIAYVANKIVSDQDISLGIAEYVSRHLSTYAAGHVLPMEIAPALVLLASLLALLPLFLLATPTPDVSATKPAFSRTEAILLHASAVSGALLFGFLVNLRYPFFPDGGERLLLFALPYALGLIAMGITYSRLPVPARGALVAPVVAISLFGIVGFYTQPRHIEQDYRSIVSVVEQRGGPKDTVLALFPWQVGYWRAYGQTDESGALYPPQPEPVGQEILTWDEEFAQSVDAKITDGRLWFPEPLSLGSSLPLEIEAHLRVTALNIEDEWQTEDTRLTAWTERHDGLTLTPSTAEFGSLALRGHALAPSTVASANSVIQVDLAWDVAEVAAENGQSEQEEIQVVLKLVDDKGRVWAERDYLSPGSLARGQSEDAANPVDSVGLQVPVGLPPGTYDVTLSVLDRTGAAQPVSVGGSDEDRLDLGTVEITFPETALPPVRVPLDHRVDVDGQSSGARILGVSGIGPEPSALAGSDLDLEIAVQNGAVLPAAQNLAPELAQELVQEISVELLGANGQPVAAWQGWPPSVAQASQWPPEAIVRVPVTLELPATVSEGSYRLYASQIQQPDDIRSLSVEMAGVRVMSRPARYEAPPMASELSPPAQFGTHVRLLGYDSGATQESQSEVLELDLHWEALQPLRPQHHIFVHVVDDEGATVAQQAGAPLTRSGPAPTGSWRPGEYLTTSHTVPVPSTASEIRIGLYDPLTGVRLPAYTDGSPVGDSVRLPVLP